MAWPWSRSHKPTVERSRRPSPRFSVDVPPEIIGGMTDGGTIPQRISRASALTVPAVLRSRNLICGTLAALPLRTHAPDRKTVEGYLLGGNIDPDIANVVVLAETYEDLLFEGVSWWRVTKFGWHGYPMEARHVPPGSVHVAQTASLLPSQAQISPDQVIPTDGRIYIDGVPVPDDEIIRFDSPNPPLLRAGARAIRTCLRLDTTAARYADEPMPMGTFTEMDPDEQLEDDEITKLLDDWDTARQNRAWAYVHGLKPEPLQWDAEKIQLADQRQHAVLEIARAAGVDPEDLGVSTTSRTYQNGEQRRLDLLDFTLSAYVAAVEQRLSMRDVLPRGYQAKVSFDGFLRSDTKTRMDTYKVGLEVGAITHDEIRELEDRPALSPSELPKPAPAPATAKPPMDDAMAPAEKEPAMQFDVDGDTTVTFDDPEVVATFRVNAEKRTISGLAVPWGKVARSGFAKWRFTDQSLYWVDPGRVKLNLYHDHERAVGRAVRLDRAAAGLDVTFKVARGAEGDRALELAEDGVLDGFSIEIDFEDGDGYQPDPADESVRLVNRAKLRGVALTAMPAFDDARVDAVAASLPNRGATAMADAKVDGDKPAAEFTQFDEHMKALADKVTESHNALTAQLGESIGESVSAGFKAALENLSSPQDGPQSVRASRYAVTREEPVYRFNGAGHSLVRDAWYAGREHEVEATERLRKYRMQTEEISKLAAASFATVTTGTASQVIPPGYRPDLYVTQLQQGRPLASALSQGVIDNATPFTVPVFTSVTGATADHVEGTNPTDGTLAFGTKTVTPGGISGRLVLTREIVDSSNPAIDQIALAAMRESYARQTEGKVYTLLNGANGAGGTITTGFVPSGAQASTYVGTTGTPPAAIAGIRKELARYPFNRFNFPTFAALGQNAAQIVSGAVDTTGRPMFPWSFGGPTNAAGVQGPGGYLIDNLMFTPAWSISGTAAGDSQILILNRSDAWVWESPTLSFRFEEKSGPALIELALFGYFATHLLRPVGLSGIRLT